MTSSCNGSNRLDSNNNTNHDNDDYDDKADKADSTDSTEQVRKRTRSLSPQPTKSVGTSSKQFLTDTGRLRPEKRPKSGHGSRRQNRERDRGSANEDGEYEVEKILGVRLYRGELQYRVKWLGYKTDWTWYHAYGFKNSPRLLREFHDANAASPGPPVRLEEWEKCWDEDRDADDHPDDNKPQGHM
jgi:hypothetical protein